MKKMLMGFKINSLTKSELTSIIGGRINAGGGRDERINAGGGRDEKK